MLETLYDQVSVTDQTLLSLPTAGFMDGTVTAQVIEYVMGAMFVVLPMFFLGAMSWAGYNVGSNVQSLLTQGAENAKVQAGKGSSQIVGGVSKLK
ncbi:hypothetical protein D3C75_618800 [compost metagenome]